jgi:predicted nucleotidyltransferase
MAHNDPKPSHAIAERWYFGPDMPVRVILRFVSDVAERFQPDRVILFGSYAYGTPHADSDVDILVIMPARNEIDQAVKIQWAIRPAFSLDLVVRTPKNMEWRVKEGDWFLREIVSRGIVLYAKDDKGMGEKGRRRLRRRRAKQSKPYTPS